MEFSTNYYNSSAGPAGTAAVVAPQPVSSPGQAVSGGFNVGANLGTSGFGTILGGFALLAVAFWLLHNG